MSIVLYNGVVLPDVVLGTDIVGYWRAHKSFWRRQLAKVAYERELLKSKQIHRLEMDKNFERVVETAIDNGIIGFDTSRAYSGSEFALGRVLKNYNREDLFIISKVSNLDQRKIGAKAALERTLEEIGTDYVDVYLLHWPQPDTFIDNWLQLEDVYINTNKCKAIGVCNCKEHHIETIKKMAHIVPMINEIEVHPLLTEKGICEYCKENKIGVLSYTSTARMDDRLVGSPRIVKICEKYGKTPAQIILKWHMQEGRVPIFNTSSCDHLIKNVCDFDFMLDDKDIAIIDGMNINSRLRYDSDNCDYEIL